MKLEKTVGFENGNNNQQGYPCTIKILLTFMYLYFVHRNDIASIFYHVSLNLLNELGKRDKCKAL